MELNQAVADGLTLTRRAALSALAIAGVTTLLARPTLAAAAGARTASQRSGKQQLGFALSHEQFMTPDLVDFAVRAESAGFDGLWSSDHIQPWQENQGHAMFPWITLALVGARTQQSFFGTGVTTPTFRYDPAVVAQAFASLAVLYPGRPFLGLGTGEALNEQAATGSFPPYQERHDRLAEAVHLMRQLWSGDNVTFHGRYYSVDTLRIYDLPSQPIPVYIAGNGPKSARLAGNLGDGWITTAQGLSTPSMHDAFREGALAAGKDPDTMPILIEDYVVVGGQAEADEAATLWRFSPIGFQKLLYISDPREIQNQAMAQLPSPWDTWRDWLVSTDPDAHAMHLQGLWDAGATHIFVHSGQQDQHRVLDFYGSQVIPRLG